MHLDRKKLIHYFLLLLLSYFVLFLKLGAFPMRWWDESMFAVNTYEMIQNGKWFSLYFNGAVDLYNTKPPLTNWFQMIFVHLFGYNELSLRLPSAIASLIVVLSIFRFGQKHFGWLFAWTSALVLLTSYGFIHYHTSRTADSDALLSCFILLANLCFISFLKKQRHSTQLLFFLFITLAFLTKLYAAFLFIPAYLVLLFYTKQWSVIFKQWSFWLGLFIMIVISTITLFLRELDAPGFLKEIFLKDAGRMIKEVENHKEPTLFYLELLINLRYSFWFVLAVLGMILAYFKAPSTQRILFFSFFTFLISYLGIIMLSVTKLEWYDMPLYPYLAMFTAYTLTYFIQSFIPFNAPKSKYQKALVLGIIMAFPYFLIFNKSQGNTIKEGEALLEAKEKYLFIRAKEKKLPAQIKVYQQEWKGALLFYKYRLANEGVSIEIIDTLQTFTPGTFILISDNTLENDLKTQYDVEEVDHLKNAKLYKVL